MLTDYHMHLVPDGAAARAEAAPDWDRLGGALSAGWIGRYVDRARARAVGEIAITDHVHRFVEARDWLDNDWWRHDAVDDVGAYCDALGAARDGGLPVLVGIEMDWIAGREEEIARFLEGRPFDVVLGSVHWLSDTEAVDHPDFSAWESADSADVWRRYLDALEAAARSGLFDVLSHPDLPKVFGHRPPPGLGDRLERAVAGIAATGIAVECSSAGLRKPVRELYPEPGLLARFRAAGVPVTLASDAHRPEDVARDYPTAVAALRGAGYETLTRFRERRPRQEAIR